MVWRLRWTVTLVTCGLLVFAVVVDTLGRLYVDRTFHVDTFVIGGLLGGALAAARIATLSGLKLPGGWELRGPAKDPTPDATGTEDKR